MSATNLTTADIGTVIDTRSVSVVFQPIVDLRTMQVAGLEAFVRGPAGSDLESPGALFAAAAAVGRVAELDWAARAAAFRAVMAANVPPAMSLFVNSEPESVGAECPPDLLPVVTRAEAVLRVFVEVNDRALASDPAGLLAAAQRARMMGWGIAVDDVGYSRAPLAMLPVVHADVVKLDVTALTQHEDRPSAAAVVMATMQHLEHTGAALCVERIETEEELRWALSIGAAYGQGRYLGAPGPLEASYTAPRAPIPLVAPSVADAPLVSPFDLMPDVPARPVDPERFEQLVLTAAVGYLAPGAEPVVCVGLGRRQVRPDLVASWPKAKSLLMPVFGVAVPDVISERTRPVRLLGTDPLADDRFLVVLNEKGGVAVHGRSQPDGMIATRVTQDAPTVQAIARYLIQRVPPAGAGSLALDPPEVIEQDWDEPAAPEADRPESGRRGVFGRRR